MTCPTLLPIEVYKKQLRFCREYLPPASLSLENCSEIESANDYRNWLEFGESLNHTRKPDFSKTYISVIYLIPLLSALLGVASLWNPELFDLFWNRNLNFAGLAFTFFGFLIAFNAFPTIFAIQLKNELIRTRLPDMPPSINPDLERDTFHTSRAIAMLNAGLVSLVLAVSLSGASIFYFYLITSLHIENFYFRWAFVLICYICLSLTAHSFYSSACATIELLTNQSTSSTN